MKPHITYERDGEIVKTLDLGSHKYKAQKHKLGVEIEVSDTNPDRVWIYLIDHRTLNRVEGAEFDRQRLTDHIMKFYDDNF